MKKMTVILLIAVLLCGSFALPVFAGEADTSLRDVLIGKNDEMVDEYLDPELFDESMEGVVWEDQPCIFFFTCPVYKYTEMPVEETVEFIFNNWASDIIILYDDPIGISSYKHNTKIGAFDFPVFSYLQDILDGDATQEFLGETCTILNVHCFGVREQWEEQFVFYITDKGTYVRFYANGTAEAVEYDWETYCEIASAYYEYITSDEYNFDENGNQLYGSLTFQEFSKNPTKYVPDYGKEPISQWLVWSLAGVGVVAVAATTVLLLRKRSKRRTAEE